MIANKCLKTIAILHRLKHTVPQDALSAIYNALFLSYVNHGITAFGNLVGKEVKRFKTTRNLKIDELFKQGCC